jgi:hypothetical protein
MTTQTEAMRLALEALDELYLPGELERVNKAITALREALAEQFCDSHCTWLDHHPDCDKVEQPAQSTADKSELETVPAKGGLLPAQHQEPVAWSVTWDGVHCGNFYFREQDAKDHKARLDAKYPDEKREVVPLYTTPQPAAQQRKETHDHTNRSRTTG